MRRIVIIFKLISIFLGMCEITVQQCQPSQTETSGTHAPSKVCSGDLIFEDNFDKFDLKIWEHENTLAGGGNGEFQWYTNNRSNSFTENGVLKIKPTLTSDQYGEASLSSMTLDINGGAPADVCTNPLYNGCVRTGTPRHIINPTKSARIRTVHSFSFMYGRIEVSAKLPTGDWLWPAIWLMPRHNVYGGWPTSGEIDIMESRGNRDLKQRGINIGIQKMGSTLHWGPDAAHNGYPKTNWGEDNEDGLNTKFHKYELLWTPENFTFKLDNKVIGSVTPPAGGFWELGNFKETYDNPWKSGTKLAPFDQEFYIIINLAVGGTAYFPDDAINAGGTKPWINTSPEAMTDFWNGRKQWLPTWNLGKNEDSYFQIDYVKVYAL